LIGIIVGLLIGAGLFVVGGFVFLVGLMEPGIVRVVTTHGAAGGNFDTTMGIVLMVAGVSMVGGILSVKIRNWEGGSDDELPED
jgi:hypothetical protein